MTVPLELQVARIRAEGDQVRAVVRDALHRMDRAQMCNLFRTCATGDLSGLDEPETKLVAWLALVAMLNLGEGRTETES